MSTEQNGPDSDHTKRRPAETVLRDQLGGSLTRAGGSLDGVGVTAGAITAAAVVIGVAAGVAVGGGLLWLAAALLTVSAVGDVLDGSVARASGSASPRGALADSVGDRVVDVAVGCGLAWWMVSGGDTAVGALCVAATFAAMFASYMRARAEGLGGGGPAPGGRVERTVATIAALCAAAAWPAAATAVVVAWCVAGFAAAAIRAVAAFRSVPR